MSEKSANRGLARREFPSATPDTVRSFGVYRLTSGQNFRWLHPAKQQIDREADIVVGAKEHKPSNGNQTPNLLSAVAGVRIDLLLRWLPKSASVKDQHAALYGEEKSRTSVWGVVSFCRRRQSLSGCAPPEPVANSSKTPLIVVYYLRDRFGK
jgi:hypothetical protein